MTSKVFVSVINIIRNKTRESQSLKENLTILLIEQSLSSINGIKFHNPDMEIQKTKIYSKNGKTESSNTDS